jgi:hypothetical protein
MAIPKNSGRQEVISAYVDVSYADLASGTAADAIDLPVGAIVIGGAVVVTAAFNSATSDALVVGDSASSNRFKSSFSIAATGLTALVPTGYVALATTSKVRVTWTGVGTAPTAGAFRLRVDYIVEKRAAFSQG